MLRLVTLGIAVLAAACGGATRSSTTTGPAAPLGVVTATIEGEPPRFVVRITRGEQVTVLLDEETPGELDYDQVTAELEEVAGSDRRVVLVQRFAERGADEFQRDLEVWLIDAARDAVLWHGSGSFANSFDECLTLDVPEPAIEGGVLVVRIARGTEKLTPDSDRCEAILVQRTEAARIDLR